MLSLQFIEHEQVCPLTLALPHLPLQLPFNSKLILLHLSLSIDIPSDEPYSKILKELEQHGYEITSLHVTDYGMLQRVEE